MSWLRRAAINVRQRRTARRLGIATRRAARRGAASSFYMGNGVIMARILSRYVLYLPCRDTSLVPGLLFHGCWEVSVTLTLASLLRPGMIVADVGANVGYFTMLMADRVGASGHVHVFEPNPELCGLLERSLFVNGLRERTTIHGTALGSENGGEMFLHVPGDAMGGAHIVALPDDAAAEGHRVPVQRLDSIPAAASIELLKIDAEGSEPEIWEGMEGLLRGSALRTILMEFVGMNYADPESLLNSIVEAGFAIQVIDEETGVIARTTGWLLAPEQRRRPLMLLLTR